MRPEAPLRAAGPGQEGQAGRRRRRLRRVPPATAERHCEACGIKFVEFRNTGRLGCSHDYDVFKAELTPLLEGIHGQARHAGKTPRRLPKVRLSRQELAKLQKKLKKAVDDEDYEEAARLRDRIKETEGAAG